MNKPDTCQVCHKSFTKDDDVVICPSCGAPYHRECYAKQGHCVYEDKHSSGFEYKPDNTAAQPLAKEAVPGGNAEQKNTEPENAAEGRQATGIVCPNCQTINESPNIFCENCGHPLHGKSATGQGPVQGQQSPGQMPPFMMGFPPSFEQATGYGGAELKGEFDGIPKQDWATYIGTSVPSYFTRMDQQDRRGSMFSFTISAFFVSTFYFAYRKMWGWAAIAFASYVVLSLPTMLWMLMDAGIPVFPGLTVELLGSIITVVNVLSFLRRLFFGFFALRLYRKHAVKKIRAIQESTPPGEAYQVALRKKGGISIVGIVAAAAAIYGVYILLYLYGGAPFLEYLMGTMNFSYGGS